MHKLQNQLWSTTLRLREEAVRTLEALSPENDWRERGIELVTPPAVGEEYQDGGLFVLNASGALLAAKEEPDPVFHDTDLLRIHTRAGLTLSHLRILAAILVGKYVVNRPLWRALLDTGLNDAEFSLDVAAPLAESLRHISCLSVSVGPTFQLGRREHFSGDLSDVRERPASSAPPTPRQRYDAWWSGEVLKTYLEILKPFYVLVIGDRYSAWEVATKGLGAEAWMRESGQTQVGHILALRNKELIGEIVFLDGFSHEGSLTQEALRDFFQFVEGGFLLGGQDFEMVARS